MTWIPTNGPNGRLPTEADGDEYSCVLWQRKSGVRRVGNWDDGYERKHTVSWMSLPPRFVPPEPKKPNRNSIWRVVPDESSEDWISQHGCKEVAECVCANYPGSTVVEYRRVLPGDPPIEGAI
jgi:hypothetical protein